MDRRAVVLLSGGLDSATCLALARHQGFACHCLTVAYGQRHAIELESAQRVAQQLGAAEHVVIPLDLAAFGGSSLTDRELAVPKEGPNDGIPNTYVPARNTIFLSLALAFAETRAAEAIFIGVNAVDYSGYPDCRPEFVEAFQNLTGVATKQGVENRPVIIRAPLISLTKPDIIRAGVAAGVDYGLTHSCYDPVDGRACGTCDSCRIRAQAFADLGIADPALT